MGLPGETSNGADPGDQSFRIIISAMSSIPENPGIHRFKGELSSIVKNSEPAHKSDHLLSFSYAPTRQESGCFVQE